MGMPLLISLLGAGAAGPVMVSLAVDMVITASLCIALSRLNPSEGGKGGAPAAVVKALKGVTVNSLPWAILLGGLVSATGFTFYGPISRVIDMLAEAGSPTALFTIGAVLARAQITAGQPSAGRWGGDVPVIVFLKLIVHPALVYAAGTVAIALGLPMDPFTLSVLVLTAALPSASNVPMLAERFGANTGRVARIVLFTTLLSFITFSIAVSIVPSQ